MREYKYFIIEKKKPFIRGRRLFINEISEKEYKKAEAKSIYKTQTSSSFSLYSKKPNYNGNMGWYRVAGKGFIFVIPISKKFVYGGNITGKIYFISTKDYNSKFWYTNDQEISRILWLVYSRKNFNETYLSQKNTIREDLIEKIKDLKQNLKKLDSDYAKATNDYKQTREKVQNQHDELFGMLSDEERLLLEVKE